MAWKVSADMDVFEMNETFTFLFFALRAAKSALKRGGKVTIERIEK